MIKQQKAKVLLTNQAGSFLLLSPTEKPTSRYEGIFFNINDEVYKAVCLFDHKSEVQHILNELWQVTRDFGKIQETYSFSPGENVIFYELGEPSSFDLVLDCRENFDSRAWGRNYELLQEKNCLVVHFSKRNDSRDDNSLGKEFDIYLAFYNPNLLFEPIQEWEEHHYEYDKKRNSSPYSRWVFRACRINAKNLVMACAASKEEAIALAKKAHNAKKIIQKLAEETTASIIKGKKVKNKDIATAAKCVRYALSSLRTNDGLYAGLPWFHQHWARDELVSSRALSLINPEAAKEIIMNWLGRIAGIKLHGPYYNGYNAVSQADALGWLFFRAEQMLPIFSGSERAFLGSKLDYCLSKIRDNLVKGLVQNGPEETWMDTTYKDGGRAGACIEIQALTLAMCRLAQKLSGRMLTLEQQLKKQTLKRFWNGRYLKDKANDATVRPNVFIAAYVYPELLSKSNWIKCFDYVLPKLWLDWGGLATIDKRHPLFTEEYTGEGLVKSYHRGDSWFWINNLAAIVLARTSKARYKNYINHILNASTQEILYIGATGHHAELSSAKELRGEGCLTQAWSNALFVELVNELF